jgi:hypothetical protein
MSSSMAVGRVVSKSITLTQDGFTTTRDAVDEGQPGQVAGRQFLAERAVQYLVDGVLVHGFPQS